MADVPALKQLYRERPDVLGLAMVDAMPRAKEDVEKLLALVAPWRAPPYRTLDMGAGIGNHAIQLGLLGHATLAYEQVPEFVTAAKGLAAKLGTYCNARFVEADARKAKPILDGLTFDLALLLDAVLGESASEEDDAKLLRDIAAVAAPGAVLVIETRNGAALASGAGVREERITATADDSGETVLDLRYRTRVYTPAELSRLVNANGWATVDARADLAGAPLAEGAARMVLVAVARGST